jgi:hypothetical protein
MIEVDILTKWIETATMILHLSVKILAVWSIDVLALIPGTFQKIGEGTKSCLIPGVSCMKRAGSICVAVRVILSS